MKKYEMEYMKCLGYDLMRITPVKSGECQRCDRLSPMVMDKKFIDTSPPKLGSPCKNFVRKL